MKFENQKQSILENIGNSRKLLEILEMQSSRKTLMFSKKAWKISILYKYLDKNSSRKYEVFEKAKVLENIRKISKKLRFSKILKDFENWKVFEIMFSITYVFENWNPKFRNYTITKLSNMSKRFLTYTREKNTE